MDHACLLFSISLLNHILNGDLFESTVVGFLAVLGIDSKKQILMEVCAYTSHLSALIKMAQMLMVQRAVLAVEENEINDPAPMLNAMRDRFLMHGTRSPFAWILRLRTYSKKVRNSITRQGYVHWSEDGEQLFYQQMQLGMAEFKEFVHQQLQQNRAQLETLLLPHQDAGCGDLVPPLQLHLLKDDPAELAAGWSFLKDERNQSQLSNESS